jgi:hypothetical protein
MASFWGHHNGSVVMNNETEDIACLSMNVIENQYKKGATDLSGEEKEENIELYNQEK